MYHTSPNEITEGTINDFGVAGDCLFFSDDIYQMSEASVYVYEADFDCIESHYLEDEEIISEIAERFGVDEDDAERMLDGRDGAHDHGGDGEDDWWLQSKRGECAVKMGFDGCEDKDEQGTVYIVPMKGRENDLKEVS